MEFIVHSSKCGSRESNLVEEEPIFVSGLVYREELVVIVWVIDMELIRTNADDWAWTLAILPILGSNLQGNTIFLVELSYLESILSN